MARISVSAPVPLPPCSSSKGRAKISFSRRSSTMSHGNSADLSISAARGATRSRAIWRTSSTSMSCSDVCAKSPAAEGWVAISHSLSGRTLAA